jgi:small-conductance mechanosensitive channel
MALGGLVLGSLIGMAIASIVAALIGELVIAARLLDWVYPWLGKLGDTCATRQNSAFAVCVFAGVTLIVFVVAAVLYVVTKIDATKFIALAGAVLYLGFFICAIVFYSTVPSRDENGYRPTPESLCPDKLSVEDAKDYLEHIAKKQEKHKLGFDDALREAVQPYTAEVAFLIVSLIGFLLLLAVLGLTLGRYSGIYDIFPAHEPVANRDT